MTAALIASPPPCTRLLSTCNCLFASQHALYSHSSLLVKSIMNHSELLVHFYLMVHIIQRNSGRPTHLFLDSSESFRTVLYDSGFIAVLQERSGVVYCVSKVSSSNRRAGDGRASSWSKDGRQLLAAEGGGTWIPWMMSQESEVSYDKYCIIRIFGTRPSNDNYYYGSQIKGTYEMHTEF
jgi:hypothetical protein